MLFHSALRSITIFWNNSKCVDCCFLHRNSRSAADTGDASAGSQEVYGCVRRHYPGDSGPPMCGWREEQRCMLRVWWCSVILPGLIRPAQIFSGTSHFMLAKRLTCWLLLLTQDRVTNLGSSLRMGIFCPGTSLGISWFFLLNKTWHCVYMLGYLSLSVHCLRSNEPAVNIIARLYNPIHPHRT